MYMYIYIHVCILKIYTSISFNFTPFFFSLFIYFNSKTEKKKIYSMEEYTILPRIFLRDAFENIYSRQIKRKKKKKKKKKQ